MTKRTGWTYLIGLAWLGSLAILWANIANLIPNHAVSLSISIIMIVIAAGVSLTGLYLLKKKRY
ncbi:MULTISPECIES: hypothetical protein [Bacillus]|jgi:uncharacterized protein (DUF1684 family)|uniref:hypothetical protein n=1 Tax=Bacillus TaxID=1386 RepID=UPI000B49ECB2|nr:MULTISPECIES: hypothetical protein [Bacillus]MDH4423952.1 hypothetical protein [Bacillus cereus]PER29718.1 hypothetical protein CN476_02275 [Bacillus cereus]PFA62251.1 hypothetical protein CN402_09075 [Bacillus sp. AFS015896]PGL84731.1 hypothetical protein CN931_10960 [Bacillus sp. AFS054943]PGX11350.1 hypothetical protein COE07_12380 [Bacillus sp. AFS033286]